MAEERNPSSSDGENSTVSNDCPSQQGDATTGQEAAGTQVSANSGLHPCQPGVSPFSMAPGPLSKVGSESLPGLASFEQPKHCQARVSRLRHQAGPLQPLGVAPRSASGLLKSYPGLEPTSPVQNLLKKSLSRSLSSWLQSMQTIQSVAHSKLPQSRQQSAEIVSQVMSAELYPGLERAISTWAQQAQHGWPPAQPMSNPGSRTGSALYPGLERAISNWAQQAQHDRADIQPSSSPAFRAAFDLNPGLEKAISTWGQQAQHDRADVQPSSSSASRAASDLYPGLEPVISKHAQHDRANVQSCSSPASRAASGLYPGLEQAISNCAQQAKDDSVIVQSCSNPASRAASGLYPGLERAMTNCAQQAQLDRSIHCQPPSNPASRAASGLYPGLERAISNWPQQAQPQPRSIPHAISGMSDVPGLGQAISSWAQQAQRNSSSEQSSPEMKQGPLHVIAMPGVADAPYPPLEGKFPISSWVQQGQEDVDHASLSAASIARAMSGMSDVPPGLEPRMPCPSQTTQDSMHLEGLLPKAMSSLSECWYPGLEPAVPICAQQAQHDSPDKAPAHASSPRSMSVGSEAWCPGLERAISNWAQQAQHGIIHSLQGASPAQNITPGEAECLYPGLEQAMTDWAQQAHCDIINRLPSHGSDCLYCPGLEPPPQEPTSPEQQPVDSQSTASHNDAALAQVIGEAILAAAKLDNPAAAAKVAAEAVTEVLSRANQTAAVSGTAIAVVTDALSQRMGSSSAGDAHDSAADVASHPGVPDSPKLLSRAGSGGPKVADDGREVLRAQASKMLKVHSRELGQHQQNKHAKLHQSKSGWRTA
ncbi:hypothetical protein ABBQ32_012729 [Trebouxia sp. C0010 RCD-2024]